MRNTVNINNNWRFTKEDKTITVDLPHTWNGVDGQDGGNDYYRGTCVYERELSSADMPEGDEVYVKFNAVNSDARVLFNGKEICRHRGGYSAFCAKLTDIKPLNTLRVEADNSPNNEVYPQLADFTFYGGIYRDVNLIGVPKKHFDLEYYGAPGLMVTPNSNGAVSITAYCDGEVNFRILADGEVVAEAAAQGKNPTAELQVQSPHLWNGVTDPYLYTAEAVLVENGQELDKISTRFGIRSFEINPEKGFILNGQPYPLRGVSRHQDRPIIGNALLPEHHREDIELICEMGANTIRLAHYQHDQYFYDLCDEKGLVVWAEIPYISKHMAGGVENTLSQMQELVCQCYNHPCIVVWGLSNEISMNGAGEGLEENHRKLNSLVKSLDKTRPTVTAVISMCSPDEPYIKIADVVSYNHYFGWYGGNVNMYGEWFDKFHKKFPNTAVGLSEYGCEALNWHTSTPEQGDYTEEYQAYYHEEVIKQIAKRPYLWATHVWNMFDFAADARAEGGENGMNHKGLVTFDRKYKKDSFYAYKAWLGKEPVLHICGKRYVKRAEDVTKITVYSNQPEVELFADGVSVGKQEKGEFPFFYFTVKNEGETVITAKAGELTDESKIEKVDEFFEEYRMKEEGGVINWFEINTPPGYYSINDTIGDVLTTFRGKIAALKVAKIMLGALKTGGDGKKKKGKADIMGFSLNKSMLDMAKGFTLKRAISMLGGKFTKEQILQMNAILNKVKKPK